jgi:hypothetical protein
VNGTFVQPLCRWSLVLLLGGVILLFVAAHAGAAYRVTNLEFSDMENGALLTIEANSSMRYSYFTIGEPDPRLVVDIFDAVHALPKYHFKNLGSSLVIRIRTSQYRPYPQPSVRVVLDMPKLIPFMIKEEDNRLVVSLEAASEEVSIAEEPSQMPAEVVPGDKEETTLPFDEQDQDKKEPAPTPAQVIVPAAVPPNKQAQSAPESPVPPPKPSEETEQSEEKVAEPSPRKEPPSAELFALGIREPVSYSRGGRRDPFASLPAKEEVEFGQAPLPNVEKLNIVGILVGENGYRALAQDDDKNGYVLRKGDPVLYGYVARIEEKRVVFRLNQRGLDRTVILKLPQ